MNDFMKVFCVSMFLLLGGCVSTAAPTVKAPQGRTQCSEPRPEVCTMEYMPVCATNKAAEKNTYSNGCTACSSTEVVYHQSGECEE